jgi:hypothetical protein
MSNPFPGMNPYLEAPAHWSNVHDRMIAILTDMLDIALPPGYVANIQERCRVVQTERSIFPDTLVRHDRHTPPQSGNILVASPLRKSDVVGADLPRVVQRLPLEPRETYIDILDAAERRPVIATIEVLSPVNKTPGGGQDQYLTKQQEILNSRTHLVEIDLLRAGLPTVAAGRPQLPDMPRYDYLVCLHRAEAGEQYEIWPVPLCDRLPRILLPLANNDLPVVLDLQAAIDHCYERGRFARQIDYTQLPIPPLTAEEAAWSDTLLREQGLRS